MKRRADPSVLDAHRANQEDGNLTTNEEPSPRDVGQRRVRHASILEFGRLTGDHSAIHFDPEAGRRAGYGGPIAHGLLTASWAVGALTRHAPERLAIGVADAILSQFSVRLSAVVRAEDVFSVRILDADESSPSPTRAGSRVSTRETARSVDFETRIQSGARSSSGDLTIELDGLETNARASDPWNLDPWEPTGGGVLYAEDFPDRGPRGRCPPRVITDEDALAFVRHTGEVNPLYTDDGFARSSRFGARVVPPMLTFCLAFSDFLRDLLSAEMPSNGFAGHLGDRWQLWHPVHAGTLLQTRHRPLEVTRSKSRPDMGILRFGLQLVDPDDRVVQTGETVMMIPARPAA